MARLFCLVVSIVLAGLCSAAPTPEEKTPAEIWGRRSTRTRIVPSATTRAP